jgi:mRNA interferase RelE/StbE
LVAEDLKEINNDMRIRIKKAIEDRLLTQPEKYGKPLRKTLKGYWKLRVGDYRIVYKIDNYKVIV